MFSDFEQPPSAGADVVALVRGQHTLQRRRRTAILLINDNQPPPGAGAGIDRHVVALLCWQHTLRGIGPHQFCLVQTLISTLCGSSPGSRPCEEQGSHQPPRNLNSTSASVQALVSTLWGSPVGGTPCQAPARTSPPTVPHQALILSGQPRRHPSARAASMGIRDEERKGERTALPPVHGFSGCLVASQAHLVAGGLVELERAVHVSPPLARHQQHTVGHRCGLQNRRGGGSSSRGARFHGSRQALPG